MTSQTCSWCSSQQVKALINRKSGYLVRGHASPWALSVSRAKRNFSFRLSLGNFPRTPNSLGYGHMTSVLDRVTEEHVHNDPYSYLRTDEALEPSYYESLAAHFPDFSDIIRRGGDDSARQQLGENNVLMHLSGLHAFNDDFPIDREWQEFMGHHFSNDFVRQVIRYLGDDIRQSYQELEERLGKNLDELTVQPRHTKDQGADIWIDVQFAVNTPVKKSSRARGRHVDDPNKLLAGLFTGVHQKMMRLVEI